MKKNNKSIALINLILLVILSCAVGLAYVYIYPAKEHYPGDSFLFEYLSAAVGATGAFVQVSIEAGIAAFVISCLLSMSLKEKLKEKLIVSLAIMWAYFIFVSIDALFNFV